jgi:hypothetical protein
MGLPLNKRDYDIFLSYAHSERAFVERLYEWLTESAGFKVWLDEHELSAGALLATDLQSAIQRCRGVILVASDESISRGWVQAEYNAAMDERANQYGFRVVALRMGNANVNQLMRGISWIDVPEGALNAEVAMAIIRSFYPSERRPNPSHAYDVYVSATWHGNDNASARAVCASVAQQGFRIIGDSTDQRGFGAGDRVERIISSCGAFIGIVPFRGEEKAVRGEKKPYNYFLKEIDIAAELELPSVIIADPRVSRIDGEDKHWLRMDTNAINLPEMVKGSLDELTGIWQEPRNRHYVFCAMDLDSEDKRITSPIRRVIELVTSMETKVGDEVHEGNRDNVNAAVRKAVCDAFLVIADLTDDNINTCIEAGMALAVGTNLELLAFGKQRRPPFMLRERNMPTYKDALDQIGLVHKISRPYRRRVLNAEL